ncbi:hypothetical protein AB5I41_15205 [Sphingomonas sp. MMS24-JH45]
MAGDGMIGAPSAKKSAMKTFAPITLAFAALALAAGPAEAKGCLKGAAVGGVGGHFVGKGHDDRRRGDWLRGRAPSRRSRRASRRRIDRSAVARSARDGRRVTDRAAIEARWLALTRATLPVLRASDAGRSAGGPLLPAYPA